MNKVKNAAHRAALPAPRTAATVMASLFFIALLLKNPDISIQYVTRGLRLCCTAVIPTLFPFMVLSELLVRTGGGARLPRQCARFSDFPAREVAPSCSVQYAVFRSAHARR